MSYKNPEKAKIINTIDVIEEKLERYIYYYLIFICIVITVAIIFLFFSKQPNIGAFVSSIFVGAGGYLALQTWKMSFIFNARQNKKNLTMQAMLSHQEADAYQTCKMTLREHFPDNIDGATVSPIKSLKTLKSEGEENSQQEERKFSDETLEEVEHAMVNLLNSYDQIGAALFSGYLDHDYLKNTIRGQVVRACVLMKHFIRESTADKPKTFEHLIKLYELWHEESDGEKHDLNGKPKNGT